MDIATLLGSYAFPIVACIVMAIYVKDITNNNREDTKALNEQHTKEMNAFKDEIKEALNNIFLQLHFNRRIRIYGMLLILVYIFGDVHLSNSPNVYFWGWRWIVQM